MCISPSKLDNGILVRCRRCWQCRQSYVNDWVGRNIAEKETASVSYAVTLTYGRSWDGRANHLRSVLLTYSDIQKMLKRMRKAGYLVRYIVAGEYGTMYERAHWHGVFHFYGNNLPEWEGQHLKWSQEKWDRVGGIHVPEWSDGNGPIGHVHIKKATYAHTRYALKYLLKDHGDDMSKVAWSKKPPLGYVYFTKLARETAERGLVPQDLTYKFRVRTMAGEEKVMPFLLRGRMAEIYLQTYLDAWGELYGKRPRPTSELVDTYEEFGRLGKEEWLTQTRVENLPGDGSRFHSDGTLKGVSTEPEPEADWVNRFEAQKARAVLRRVPPTGRVRDKTDWLIRWMEENGETLTGSEREQFEREYWLQARASGCAAAGITEAEFAELSPSDRLDLLNNPTRWKSLQRERVSRHRRGNSANAKPRKF